MLKNSKFRLVISLLVAIALWLYVVGNVDPTITATISGIQVEKVGEDILKDMDLKATLESPETIEIVIKGPRSAVNSAKKKEFKATVDVSNCEYGENVENIKVVFPDDVSGITVDSMTEKIAHFTVE